MRKAGTQKQRFDSTPHEIGRAQRKTFELVLDASHVKAWSNDSTGARMPPSAFVQPRGSSIPITAAEEMPGLMSHGLIPQREIGKPQSN